jgi:hypothetical protein
MKKIFGLLIIVICLSCVKEERTCYDCQTYILQTIRNKSEIKPDTTMVYTQHCEITAKELVIMKNINTFTAVQVYAKDTINVQYIMKCKLSN